MCDSAYEASFRKGMDLDGLKDHSLSRKMQLLQRLQEKVMLFSETINIPAEFDED